MSNKLDEARKIIDEVDSQMAQLFVQRMKAAEMVYEHKKEFGLPILDPKREDAVIEKNTAQIEDDVLKGYYIDYIKHLMSVSRGVYDFASSFPNAAALSYIIQKCTTENKTPDAILKISLE